MKHFFKSITENPVWTKANDMGILSIPVMENWESRDFHAHIVPVWTRQRYNWWLVFHLQLSGISAFPIDYPTVPKGQSRIRLMIHASNTDEQVSMLAATIQKPHSSPQICNMTPLLRCCSPQAHHQNHAAPGDLGSLLGHLVGVVPLGPYSEELRADKPERQLRLRE